MGWGEPNLPAGQRVVDDQRREAVADALRHKDAELRNGGHRVVLAPWGMLMSAEKHRWFEMADTAAEAARG